MFYCSKVLLNIGPGCEDVDIDVVVLMLIHSVTCKRETICTMNFPLTDDHHALARTHSERIRAAGVNPQVELEKALEPVKIVVSMLLSAINVGIMLYAWLGLNNSACPTATLVLKVDAIASIFSWGLNGVLYYAMFTKLLPVIRDVQARAAAAEASGQPINEEEFTENILPALLTTLAQFCCVLCLLIPLGCFLTGWWVYALVVFFRQVESPSGNRHAFCCLRRHRDHPFASSDNCGQHCH